MKRFLTTSLTVLALTTMAHGASAQSMATKAAGMDTSMSKAEIMPVRNEAEFRSTVIGPGTMSLKGSELALTKATNAKVKEFAQFETTEQNALGMILKELNTPAPTMSAKDMSDAKKLTDAAKGPSFDKAYAMSQTEGHETLLKITESYLKNADLTSTDPKEMEARHLAYFMKAAIIQHIVNTKELTAMLGK